MVTTSKGEKMKKSWFSNPVIIVNGKRIPSEEVKSVEMKFKKASDPVLTIELNSPIQIGEFVTTGTNLSNGPTKTGLSSEVFTTKEVPSETFVLSDYSLQILEKESPLRQDRTRFLPRVGSTRDEVEERLKKLVKAPRVDLETNYYALTDPDSEKRAVAELKNLEKALIDDARYEVIDVALAPFCILDTTGKSFQISESFFVYLVPNNINEAEKTEN